MSEADKIIIIIMKSFNNIHSDMNWILLYTQAAETTRQPDEMQRRLTNMGFGVAQISHLQSHMEMLRHNVQRLAPTE